VHHPKRQHQHVALQSATSKAVPASFDWRNVNGVNYVSPVRDQGQCGSCYAFSAAGMMEARIRVRSNNTQQPILSTQDVVSCSLYRYANNNTTNNQGLSVSQSRMLTVLAVPLACFFFPLLTSFFLAKDAREDSRT
jgi:C1A family cysteine protease